ncbi:sugar phosphate isomerase/epimerase family protein [Nibrella viscosa]
MMTLGIGTYTYGWAIGVPDMQYPRKMLEHQLLAKTKAFGLSLVQIGDNLPLHTFAEERLDYLYRLSRSMSIELEVGARGLTPDYLHRYIDIAAFLKARILRFVIDQPGYEPPVPDIVSIIQEANSSLKRQGVTLALENHDRLKARQFREIIEKVGSKHVGICLDSANSLGAAEGLETIVDCLAPYTVNLHLKDFGIQRLPHKMGFQIDGRPAGKGMLNIPWLLEKISKTGKCHTAILEQWVVPETEQDDTLRKEEQWANESLQYLKPLFESKSPITFTNE